MNITSYKTNLCPTHHNEAQKCLEPSIPQQKKHIRFDTRNIPLTDLSLRETSMLTPNSNSSNDLVVKLHVASLMHNAHINYNEMPMVGEYKRSSKTLWRHGIAEG
jgi:hypothetical protein